MKHNPKIVNFNASPAFAYHRAMVNRRENNPLDALELLRSAVERSPENAQYRLQLARQYADIGWDEKACQLALDILANPDAPADAYLVLAESLLSMGQPKAAEQLLLYALNRVSEEEFILDAQRVLFAISLSSRPESHRSRRADHAERIAARALKALAESDPERAAELFESCPPLSRNQNPIRIQYAAALCASGKTDRAVAELETALSADDSPMNAVMSAELFHTMGDTERARTLLQNLLDKRAFPPDPMPMIYALYEVGMYEDCANCARLALQESPHDRYLLHARAAALCRAGAPDKRCARYWLHILKIDPEDAVAQYYLSAAERGELRSIEPDCLYKLPQAEFARRYQAIRAYMKNDSSVQAHSWQAIPEFRDLVHWAAQSDSPMLQTFVALALACCDDAPAQSLVRQMLITREISPRAKLEVMLFANIRGIQVGGALNEFFSNYIGITAMDAQMQSLNIGDRKLISEVREYLADEYQMDDGPLPAQIWRLYRRNARTKHDLVPSMEAAMGALAYYCLKARKKPAFASEIHRQIGGSRRKMEHYIRRFSRALDSEKGRDKR